MARVVVCIVIVCASLPVFAVPELTAGQRRQLDATVDGDDRFDEGPLYALLSAAVGWPNGDEGGAVLMGAEQWAAVRAEPGDWRGRAVVFAGQVKRVRDVRLQRSGAWGESVTEIALAVEGLDEAGQGRVVLVYWVGQASPQNPSASVGLGEGDRVRLAAWFYKWWREELGQSTDGEYAMFVGGSVVVTESASGPGAGTGGAGGVGGVNRVWLVGAMVLAGLVGLVLVRRYKAARVTPVLLPSQRLRDRRLAREAAEAEREALLEEAELAGLPEDAAEALGVLESRGETTEAQRHREG
ncbi:MAG: hypothetical protein AAF797_04745 [Planctomycetota bacterium]